ncbi:MAG: sugar phosphate isomerase/epimerase [Candidatus Hydrogenedentes bacterium]|nr:sugar phosphate isomerase/epimerase [Candidatus Hydrogenedentota bacterium]
MRNSLFLMGLAGLISVYGVSYAGDEFCPPLGVRILSYGNFQDKAWEHLQSIGVKYIFIPVPPAEQVNDILNKFQQYNLTALVVRGNVDLTQESYLQQFKEQFEISKKLGAKYMFISAKRGETPKEVIYERLKRAGNIAEEYDITIVLETHPDLGTNGDVQLETMRAINHPRVRINFDTGNITYYNQNTDAVTELKKSIPYVATVELKDHTGEFETWNFPALGKGKVNFQEILKILKEHHYRGPITIEFEGIKGVELTEEEIKIAIESSVNFLRNLGCFK